MNDTNDWSKRQNLTFDDNGPRNVPLSTPDDSEALYNVCKITRGCFLDEPLLKSALNVFSSFGEINISSTRRVCIEGWILVN